MISPVQALCTRYGLAIGAYSSWFVRLLMLVCGVVAYPISLLLDYLLGSTHHVRLAVYSISCFMSHLVPVDAKASRA